MPKGFQKGVVTNPNGRKKGTPNKTTQEAREMLEQILYSQFDNINASLSRLNRESDARYIDALSKLITYVMPKKTDVTSDGKAIVPEMPTVIVKTKNGSD